MSKGLLGFLALVFGVTYVVIALTKYSVFDAVAFFTMFLLGYLAGLAK